MGKMAYLVCVNGDANNNKFYQMVENGDGTFTATYGRLGRPTVQTAQYSMSRWAEKYNEKIYGKAGKEPYEDRSHLKQETVVTATIQDDYKPILNKYAAELVMKLQSFASDMIRKHYQVTHKAVTQAMVDAAQDQISSLMRTSDVYLFNERLQKLFGIIPRNMGKVKDFLAKSTGDFGLILDREQELLDVMAGQVSQPSVVTKKQSGPTKDITILEDFGLEMDRVDDAEMFMLKRMMAETSGQFHKAWKVKNLATEERFQKCLKDDKIKTTKLLFHGSRNENWWNITKTGLLLKPGRHVITTASMFGHGLYFAPKAQKSMGYTSVKNSRWARGDSDKAYLAVYEVAYGKPYDVHKFLNEYSSYHYSDIRRKGCDCMHAHASPGMIYNDEIIVYREEQATIRYLIEIKQ